MTSRSQPKATLGRVTLIGVSVLVAFFVFARRAADAQALDCSDVVPTDGDDRYRLRGDRCEGTFRPYTAAAARPHSASVGHVGMPDLNGNLRISWPEAAAQMLVMVESWDSKIAYRVKTVLPASRAEFSWPNAILVRAGVKEIATLVQTEVTAHTTIPACGSGDRSAYEVSFAATEPLTHVVVKVFNDTDIIWRTGPADMHTCDLHLQIPMSSFKADGVYHISFVANGAATDLNLSHRAGACK